MRRKEFDALVESVREAGKIKRGDKRARRAFEFKPTDVKRVRRRLGRSQTEFARMIGVSVATLRNWEQARRVPEGPARALLTVASKNPQAVADALGA